MVLEKCHTENSELNLGTNQLALTMITHEKRHGGLEHILVSPHITEKASEMSEIDTYSFVVDMHAEKADIIRAVQTFYGVKPVSVRVVLSRGKAKMVRGKVGRRSAFKKAYVKLAKGQTLNLG